MQQEIIIALFKYAIVSGASVMGPILLTGLVIGISVGALQAATQVNEPTLTFVPKILGVSTVGAFILPWGMDRYVGVVRAVAQAIVEVAGQ